MPVQKLLIANTQMGLEKDLTQWLIPDDAFPLMQDFYIFRGRILRRKGYETLGRLTAASVFSQATGSSTAPDTYNNTIGSSVEPGTLQLFLYDSSGPPPTLVNKYIDAGLGGLQCPAEARSTITGITLANPPEVTTSAAHGYATGTIVFIEGVEGLANETTGESSVNNQAFTITSTGATTFTLDGQNFSTGVDPYSSQGESSRGATIDYSTGAYYISWSAIGGTTPYLLQGRYTVDGTFPCLPTMGIKQREISSINNEETIFFDTQKSNIYNGTNFVDVNFYKTSATAFSWTGTNADFFHSANYANAFFSTNFLPGLHSSATATTTGDGIRWYDGDEVFTNGWVNFNPEVDSATNYRLLGARLIVPYYGRLVVLNTYEGTTSPGTNYPQRARFSQIGTPFPATGPGGGASPTPTNWSGSTDDSAWDSSTPGKGGFVDAPTSEHIVSAKFYKDQLIVFFERSTWALLYNGNKLLPFTWERINSELGCESPNSTVQFDNGILAVGNRGVVQASGNSVTRIDSKIPDEVFNFKNAQGGNFRIQGIRDYFDELVYWTVPEAESTDTYPNRLLVYNYKTGSFSFFRDSFTALGYIQFDQGYIWDQTKINWEDADWNWDSPKTQSLFPNVCAGNQLGYIFLLNIQNDNGLSLAVLSYDSSDLAAILVTTCGEHGLSTGDFVKFNNVTGGSLARTGESMGTALSGSTTFPGRVSELAITPGSVTIDIGALSFTDPDANGLLTPGGGTIDYESGKFTVNYATLSADTAVTMDYTQTINGKIVKVTRISSTVIQLEYDFTGFSTPTNATGEMAVVNNPILRSKRFNPFVSEALNVKFITVDWYTDSTVNGEYQIKILYDDIPEPLVDGQVFTVNTKPERNVGLGNLNQFRERMWHRMYLNSIGSFLQMELTLDDEQMVDTDINSASINIQAILIRYEHDGRIV